MTFLPHCLQVLCQDILCQARFKKICIPPVNPCVPWIFCCLAQSKALILETRQSVLPSKLGTHLKFQPLKIQYPLENLLLQRMSAYLIISKPPSPICHPLLKKLPCLPWLSWCPILSSAPLPDSALRATGPHHTPMSKNFLNHHLLC